MFSGRAVPNRIGLGKTIEFADHWFLIRKDSNGLEKMRIHLLQFAQEPRFTSRCIHGGIFAAQMLRF